MSAIRYDEEAQKKGIVLIVYNAGVIPKLEEMRYIRRVHAIHPVIPKRVVGAHYCYSAAALRPFAAWFQLFLDKDMRNRYRSHYGTHAEIQFHLQTFGISITTTDNDQRIVSDDGSLSLT